jgi:DNA-nicking Smr family endonuclease
MAKDTKISPEDSALFRESIGTVRRFKHDRAAITAPRSLSAPPRLRRSEGPQILIHDSISDDYHPAENPLSNSGVEFARTGLQQGVLRKLRRGQFTAEAELDLHGLTVIEARTALAHFLQLCRDRGTRHVRIIHGQGNSSREGRPVLKGKVYRWLQQLDEVLAFCPARPEHGGAGALYVLLKRH